MSRFEQSLPARYFDELYARDADPWRFASSPYEKEKYAATLAALPRVRYRSGLEIGCSIGIFTRQLAARADMVHALDIATKALDEARHRCADLHHVSFELGAVPKQWPDGQFDLIVLSEVVYYLDRADVAALAERVRESIVPGGDIVLVHWLGETHYPLTGDEAVTLFETAAMSWARRTAAIRDIAYRLDVLRANEPSQEASPPVGCAVS